MSERDIEHPDDEPDAIYTADEPEVVPDSERFEGIDREDIPVPDDDERLVPEPAPDPLEDEEER